MQTLFFGAGRSRDVRVSTFRTPDKTLKTKFTQFNRSLLGMIKPFSLSLESRISIPENGARVPSAIVESALKELTVDSTAFKLLSKETKLTRTTVGKIDYSLFHVKDIQAWFVILDNNQAADYGINQEQVVPLIYLYLNSKRMSFLVPLNMHHIDSVIKEV